MRSSTTILPLPSSRQCQRIGINKLEESVRLFPPSLPLGCNEMKFLIDQINRTIGPASELSTLLADQSPVSNPVNVDRSRSPQKPAALNPKRVIPRTFLSQAKTHHHLCLRSHPNVPHFINQP